MNILITGAGGFVGKHLTRYLAAQGHCITAVVKTDSVSNELNFFDSERVKILRIDLASLDINQLPSGIDAVFSLAQSAHYKHFREQAEDIFEINIHTNFKLWSWARQTGVKICIYVSSGGIYGKKRNTILSENDFLIMDSELGFYLSSKLCSEIIFHNFADYFKTSVVLRPFFIYGPGQKKDMFIGSLLKSVQNKTPVYLHGNDGLKVNPIFIEDAVHAMVNTLKLNGKHIINLAGGEIMSLRRIVDTIGSMLKTDPVYKIKPVDPLDYIGDITLAEKNLNMPTRPFKEGLRKTIQSLIL